MNLTLLSLFAGVGGLDLGFERAGIRSVGQVEIDAYCRRVLAARFPGTPQHDDVRTAAAWWGDRPSPTIVAGGFPCWDLSRANPNRRGLERNDGHGSELYWAALDVMLAAQPAYVVLENVAGLLKSNDGRDFAAVLDSLALCGYPYAEWRVLDARFFGVPQRRRRVFVVAGRRAPRGGAILHEREGGGRDPRALRPGAAAAGSGGAAARGGQGPALGGPAAAVHPDRVGAAPGIPRRLDRGPWVKRGAKQTATTGFETWANADLGGYPSRTLNTMDHGDARAPMLAEGKAGPCGCCPVDPEGQDGRRYTAMGNAVAVPVARWIGERLRRAAAYDTIER